MKVPEAGPEGGEKPVAPHDVEARRRLAELLGVCFWRHAPETADGPDRRAGERGLTMGAGFAEWGRYTRKGRVRSCEESFVSKVREAISAPETLSGS